jgi:mono/diheme cytochrome c family protein
METQVRMLYFAGSTKNHCGSLEMKFGITSLLIALIAIFITSCSSQTAPTTTNRNTNAAIPPSATPDPFASARGVFAKDCQSCHGVDGKGGPVKLEDGTRLRVPSLREGHALRHPDSDFRKQIVEGGDGMPSFKTKLSSQQVDELIKFIRQEFEGGITPPPEKGGKQ